MVKRIDLFCIYKDRACQDSSAVCPTHHQHGPSRGFAVSESKRKVWLLSSLEKQWPVVFNWSIEYFLACKSIKPSLFRHRIFSTTQLVTKGIGRKTKSRFRAGQNLVIGGPDGRGFGKNLSGPSSPHRIDISSWLPAWLTHTVSYQEGDTGVLGLDPLVSQYSACCSLLDQTRAFLAK